RITLNEGADRAFAERILDQALAFLAACGRFPGNKLAPSKPVEHSKDPASVRDITVGAIRRAGYVDTELWIADAYNCGTCHEDGNCAASGKDGNENTDTRTTSPPCCTAPTRRRCS
ncbi:MAG: hypothetical protein ACRDTC_09855, partial [Pseudonocardiaceae bacterium]